jgi:hypothetical protein
VDIKWAPYHIPENDPIEDGDSLQIYRLVKNMLERQSQRADKE